MPVRAVCKPHYPDLKRGALATDARGCSLWRSLLERLPLAPESRVRDPLGELVRTRVGGVTYGRRSFRYSESFLWNKLPLDIKGISSMVSFSLVLLMNLYYEYGYL